MWFNLKKFLVFLLTGCLLFSSPQLIDYFVLPASASISQQEILVSDRLVQNIKDELGNVWELNLFEKDRDNDSDLILRLVGFPLFEIDRTRSLHITTDDGSCFEVEDLFNSGSPAFHVAEYNFSKVLSELPNDPILELTYYLTGDKPHGIVVSD